MLLKCILRFKELKKIKTPKKPLPKIPATRPEELSTQDDIPAKGLIRAHQKNK